MLLGQVRSEGAIVAAVFEDGLARPIPEHTMIDLLKRAEVQNIPLSKLADQLAIRHPETIPPVLPIHPPEVYGCGCTYEASSSFRDAEHGTREGMYAYVYREARPEIFFKGTARVCAGPGQSIGIRADSRFTAPEPELAVVLGRGGRIAGYTLANDVSAWDIERENALYLPQSKMYDACCALGPAILPAEDLPDPYQLEMTCTITRGGQERFSGSVAISKLHRKIETLIEFLTRSNHVPAGTVVMTGTGIIVPQEGALAPGDVVTISVPQIGVLSNPAALVQ
jgi:2-dehydro-3-deoxy-D-arabinonate dehydratase